MTKELVADVLQTLGLEPEGVRVVDGTISFTTPRLQLRDLRALALVFGPRINFCQDENMTTAGDHAVEIYT